MRHLLAALLLGTALAAPAADPGRGQAVYEANCAPCHAPGLGHAGTQRLGERLGQDKAVLLERTDLVPEYVRAVVRSGFMMMPGFRDTDITDADLEALAAYVAGAGKGK